MKPDQPTIFCSSGLPNLFLLISAGDFIIIIIIIIIYPPLGQDMTQGQFLSEVLA